MWKIGAAHALNAFKRSTIRATASGLLRRLPAASHWSNARWTSTTIRAVRSGLLLIIRTPENYSLYATVPRQCGDRNGFLASFRDDFIPAAARATRRRTRPSRRTRDRTRWRRTAGDRP